jgi:hypothetical protein
MRYSEKEMCTIILASFIGNVVDGVGDFMNLKIKISCQQLSLLTRLEDYWYNVRCARVAFSERCRQRHTEGFERLCVVVTRNWYVGTLPCTYIYYMR